MIRCETVRFRLQKYRNGGQLWAVNVFSYTIHAQSLAVVLPPCPFHLFPLLLRTSLAVRSRNVGGRVRLQGNSTWGERTQSFPCTIRCETVRFRLQKYRNGGQLWVVNVFSYTIHAQTDCWPWRSPLALSIFFPLLLWRFLSSQLFCVSYKHRLELLTAMKIRTVFCLWSHVIL
jgi:hypothetical protein